MKPAPEDREAYIDRVCGEIVNLLNREADSPGFSPVNFFAAQLLALTTFMDTAANAADPPPSFLVLHEAVNRCLGEIAASMFLPKTKEPIEPGNGTVN